MKNTAEDSFPMINFDQKQRINLSSRAADVLQTDAAAFYDDMNRTGFLNELLKRCAAGSDATIDLAVGQYRQHLEDVLKKSLKKSEFESDLTKKEIYILSQEYETQLAKKALSWPKGTSVLFRLSNDNSKRFYGDFDIRPVFPVPPCYNGKVSRYLKAIVEEYASHTLFKREELFFHEEIGLIQMAIESEKLMRIVSSVPGRGLVSWDVRAYRILPDDSGLYHYIAGMVAPAHGLKSEEHIASLRLSRIREIHIIDAQSARSGHLTSVEKKEIESRIEKNRVQFLAGDREDIIVRLTSRGKSTMSKVLYMRPRVDFIDEDGNYHFSCSRLQATFYFQKFGADAEILEPAELRSWFIDYYQHGYEQYHTPEQ